MLKPIIFHWNFSESGQGTSEEIRSRDLRKELEERETSTKSSKQSASASRRALEASAKRAKYEQNPDADDPVDSKKSDEDDSDDDTAALLAELNKIKRERAVENAKKEEERQKQEEKIRMENILSGNPLLNYASGGPKANAKIKRRWNDDVVFKNCARTEVEKPDHFVNDSLRSEFHKKFMEKYIK